MMNNEDKFYRDLIKKFFDNFYYFIKKHPQDRKPQSKEEKILLPFLLQWMKERKDRKIIKDEFNQVYKKGWIPIYSEENVQKMDAYLLCTGITYSVCEMLIANKLIDSKEDIYNLFRRSSTNKFQISETDYKKILCIYYCMHFYNTDLLQKRGIESKFVFINKIISNIVKKEIVSNVYEEASKDISEKTKLSIQRNFHKSFSDSVWESIDFILKNYFAQEDIVLQYKTWKMEKEMDTETLKRNLFYSLVIRIPLSQQKQFFVSLLYYWHYGLVEGHYADTIFDGLHGEFGLEEKRLLARLLVLEQNKETLKYFQEKYKSYCDQKQIPANEQIKPLTSSLELKPAENNSSSEEPKGLYQLDIPEGFDDTRLNILVGLLESKLKFIDVDDKNSLAYFLGKATPKPPRGYNIRWKGSIYSLKYFFKQLYKNIASGTWISIHRVFMVKIRGEYKHLESYLSLSNLSIPKCEERLGELSITAINDCINLAKNSKTKK